MAEEHTSAKLFQALTSSLKAQETVTDLFRLASSEDFRAAVRSLPADQQTALRVAYREMQTALDGKVKLEQFDNTIIRIVGVDWWHSDTYDNDGVTLKFNPEHDSAHTYKALTSSAPIVRFCNRFANELPSPADPVRAFVKLEPVRDVERARAGQRIWTIKALPTVEGVNSASPF